MRKRWIIAAILLGSVAVGAIVSQKSTIIESVIPGIIPTDLKLIKDPKTSADKIVNGAKKQVNDNVYYDASYATIAYPGGDVPADRGACTDVIIRALRNGGFDLQKLIHEDMKGHFSLYPKKWGLTKPDSNIDHRRIPNHLAFMKRFGTELTKKIDRRALDSWQPGDLVYWDYGNSLTHCGVISNDIGPRGLPMVIHNNGPCASQEDVLDSWPVLGHFRYPKG